MVRRYRNGKIVVAKYPDLSGVVPTAKQKARRALFREAVGLPIGSWPMQAASGSLQRPCLWERRRRMFQTAIQLYMRLKGNQRWLRKQLAAQAVGRVQQEDRLWPKDDMLWEGSKMGELGSCVQRRKSNGEGDIQWAVEMEQGLWRVLWQKQGEVVDDG